MQTPEGDDCGGDLIGQAGMGDNTLGIYDWL